MEQNKVLRRSNNKMLAGVAAGLAEYANLDPALVRLVIVLLTLAGGPGLIIYIVLWAVMAPPTNG
jgi:phage shock protein PspC (stress-responsive transcriptional regulator)